jgi:hypothetical protein
MSIEAKNPRWAELYKIGAIAAIISEVVLAVGLIAYFIYPFLPGTASTESIFLLLQKDTLGGLISLDFHLVLGNLFGILLFIALYIALKPVAVQRHRLVRKHSAGRLFALDQLAAHAAGQHF